MPNLTWYGSPNFTPGRTDIEFVVIHWMDGYLAGADATFQNTVRQTSAHYGVEDDTIHQYVDEANTAWHAGNFDANSRSIGIEHSAMPGRPASDATYASTIWLITGICQRHGLDPAVAILPHQHFTSTDCPGTMDLPRIIAGVQAALGGTIAQASTITPIQEDLVPNATDPVFTSKDGATVSLQDLLNSIDMKAEAALTTATNALHEATNAKNNAADSANRVSFAYANLPAAVWNAKVLGASTAAGVLNHIDATSAAPQGTAPTTPLDIDAIATAVAAKLSADFRAQINK